MGCGTKLLGKERQACGQDACKAAARRNQASERTRLTKRYAPRGRECKDCLARDDEVNFANAESCEACYLSFHRCGRCERCQTILRSNDKTKTEECHRCNPPRYEIEVLWEAPDGRLRRLFRAIKYGKVNIAGRSYLVKANPFSIKVPEVKTWVKIRT